MERPLSGVRPLCTAMTDGPKTAPRKSLPITCAKYEPVTGTKRCRHYQANGACGLPDEFMCIEWRKANGQTPAPPVKVAETPRDLFGQPVPSKPAESPKQERVTTVAPRRVEVPIVRTLADADLASFKALGVEVRLATDDLGELWLVPAYTGADRQELSVDHAALLATICSALPGAHVTALVRRPPSACKRTP